MSGYDSLTPQEQVGLLEAAAHGALREWDIEGATLGLLKHRENAVFSVQKDDFRAALRLHRHGYHTDAELRSELQWMQALSDAGIRVPEIIPAVSGEPFVNCDAEGLPGTIQVDLFRWIDGRQLGSVEAGIDDVEIHGVGPNAGLVALSSGVLGSTAALGVSGAAGATSFVLFAPAAGGPTSIPGVQGDLLLDASSLGVAGSVTLDADGSGQFDLTIPSTPGLAGATARFQVLEVTSVSLTLGDMQSITLR